MKNLINKIIFFWRRPKIVVPIERDQRMVEKIISQVLGSSSKIEKEILFVDDVKKVNFSDKKYLVLNFDEGMSNVRKFKEKTWLQILTFGFKEGADFQATDIKINGDTNFKINYQGKIVPFWLGGAKSHKEIYSVLTAIATGTALNLNLVEISQSLKEERG